MENPDHEYLINLNQVGLVCDAFVVLSATENVLIN